jgi:hypothetical protein
MVPERFDASALELIVYGSCSPDEQVPNSASGVQFALGATRAAAMDVNTACTSFLYGLSSATAMIQSGMEQNALVIGVEYISPFMDWSNRNVAVLFGDGAAAVVLQASDTPSGVIGTVLGCDAEARQTLRVRGMGCSYVNGDLHYGDTLWDFDGQAIFKRAVHGMSDACGRVMQAAGVTADDIDLVLGHRDSSGTNTSLADFLSTLDGVRQRDDILTIATTNDPKSLDPAAQRSNRFDMVIALPMPDATSRARILERHLGPLGLDLDLHALAELLEGATGADVKEVIRRAVLEHGDRFTQAQLVEIAESGRWQATVNRRKYL